MRSAAADLARTARLPVGELALLLRAALLLPMVALALRVLPLDVLLRLPDRPAGPGPAIRAERIAALVEAAALREPFRVTCLHKAFALYTLLRRRGIEAELVMGTAHAHGGLEAHAWVEHRGAALGGGTPTETFAPLVRWPGRRGGLPPSPAMLNKEN
jgi:hypothetical protein